MKIYNGYRNGGWKVYYESTGTISQEMSYKNGLLNGSQKVYNETGEIYAAGQMIDDLRDGEWNWYHVNGIISSSVHFKQGKKEGLQSMFSEAGVLIKEEYYKNGDLIEETVL